MERLKIDATSHTLLSAVADCVLRCGTRDVPASLYVLLARCEIVRHVHSDCIDDFGRDAFGRRIIPLPGVDADDGGIQKLVDLLHGLCDVQSLTSRCILCVLKAQSLLGCTVYDAALDQRATDIVQRTSVTSELEAHLPRLLHLEEYRLETLQRLAFHQPLWVSFCKMLGRGLSSVPSYLGTGFTVDLAVWLMRTLSRVFPASHVLAFLLDALPPEEKSPAALAQIVALNGVQWHPCEMRETLKALLHTRPETSTALDPLMDMARFVYDGIHNFTLAPTASARLYGTILEWTNAPAISTLFQVDIWANRKVRKMRVTTPKPTLKLRAADWLHVTLDLNRGSISLRINTFKMAKDVQRYARTLQVRVVAWASGALSGESYVGETLYDISATHELPDEGMVIPPIVLLPPPDPGSSVRTVGIFAMHPPAETNTIKHVITRPEFLSSGMIRADFFFGNPLRDTLEAPVL